MIIFEVERSDSFLDGALQRRGVPTCFPRGYDRSDLRNVTCVGDLWAKFINVRTGEVVDCAEFAKQMEEQNRVGWPGLTR